MESNCPFAPPVREFLTYLRVEAGLAAATLDAYGRDLRGLMDGLRAAFGTLCTPENPLGAPMVSSEGACAAYFNYGRLRQVTGSKA